MFPLLQGNCTMQKIQRGQYYWNRNKIIGIILRGQCDVNNIRLNMVEGLLEGSYAMLII